MKDNFYTRYAFPIVLAALLTVPAIVFGVYGALSGGNNDLRQWLPKGFAEARDYDWFLKHFGSEEMVVVSWPGATLDDERLDRVAEGLTPYLVQKSAGGDSAAAPPLFRSVKTGRAALAELTGPPLRLSHDEAVRRLEGSLVGPDGRTSGMVVTISDEGTTHSAEALATIYRVAETHAGLSPSEMRMGGPTVDNVALDVESTRSLNTLAVASIFAALLLAWRCLKRVRLVLIVFATALLCAGSSLAMVHYTGGSLNLVLVMMPTLIYVLSISGAIHLVNYYREAVAKGGSAGAPLRALAAGWRPCTLAASTTAVGLGSLAVSEIIPVKMFGIYASLGVLGSLPVLFLFLPAALTLWPLEQERRNTDQAGGPADGPHWSEWMTALVGRHHAAITAVSLALMAFVGYGLTQVETSVKLMSFFSPDVKIVRDYVWLEKHLGPLVPVEIVLDFKHTGEEGQGGGRMTDRLELVGAIQEKLESIDMVGGTMSAATFAPAGSEATGFRSVLRRRIIEERLQESRERFVEASYLRPTEQGELWRVSARVEALNDVNYGYFIEVLGDRIEPLVRAWSAGHAAPVSATYTGVVPLVYKAQHELMSDLIASFITAFLLIGVALMVMLRSLQAGLLSMIPSLFPAVVVFGVLGWLQMPVGIGSMMTASLALGIAVDDTIHFLSWFRKGVRQGLSRKSAVQMAYQRCAGAMLQTTLICGLGLLIFALSDFVPTVRFAWMMFSLLVMALLGDLILLPAMLVGRWGRYFEQAPAGETAEAGDPLMDGWKRLLQGTEPLTPQPVPVQSD